MTARHVAAEVGAEREQARRDRDEPHRLGEESAREIARLDALLEGGLVRKHARSLEQRAVGPPSPERRWVPGRGAAAGVGDICHPEVLTRSTTARAEPARTLETEPRKGSLNGNGNRRT